MRRAALPLVLLAVVVGCGGRSSRHGARGIVRDVQPEYGQVVIEHEAGRLLRDLRRVASD